MANFPIAYAASGDLSVHSIHNSSEVPLWIHDAETEDPTQNAGLIDVYTFSEGAGAGQTAYALLIAKNSGDSGSNFIFAAESALVLNEGTLGTGGSGFSIVTNIADATVNSIPRIITTADFNGGKDEASRAHAHFGASTELLTLTSRNKGVAAGEAIRIRFIDDDSINNSPTVVVSSNDITITVEDGTTTFGNIITAIEASVLASALLCTTAVPGVPAANYLLGGIYEDAPGTEDASLGTAWPAVGTTGFVNLVSNTITGLTTGGGYQEPLGYFPIRDYTMTGDTSVNNPSVEITSGALTETHAGNVGANTDDFKYIPIYTPAQLLGNTVQNTGGKAHYAGVLIKFEASEAVSVTSAENVVLNFSVINADNIEIQLIGSVIANSTLGLQTATAEGVSGTGLAIANLESVSITTSVTNALFDVINGTAAMDTISEQARMRHYPINLVENNGSNVVEYIRILNSATSTSTISYFGHEFGQLGGLHANNGLDSTKFQDSTPAFVLDQTGVVKLITDDTEDTVADEASTVWTYGSSGTMTDTVTSINEISLTNEHYISLVRDYPSDSVSMHDNFAPDDTLSGTYAETAAGFGTLGNSNWRPQCFRVGFKYYPYYLSATNNSGLHSSIATISSGSYLAWTPSQEMLARFRKTDVNTVQGTMKRNGTYRAPVLNGAEFGSVQADYVAALDTAPITSKSIINSNSATDQVGGSIIQPIDSSANPMIRSAIGDHNSQPNYDQQVDYQFNVIEPNPSVNFAGAISGSSHPLYCNKVNWSGGNMKDSNSNTTGYFLLEGNDASSFTKQSQHSATPMAGGNILGDNDTRMSYSQTGNFTDMTTNNFASGAEKRAIYFKLKFEPKGWIAYSLGQDSHNAITGSDAVGRNVYESQLTVTGGYNAVHTVGNTEEKKNAILLASSYPSLGFNAMAWPEHPEISLVTNNSSGATGTFYKTGLISGHTQGASVTKVAHTGASTMNWYDTALPPSGGSAAAAADDPGGADVLPSYLDMVSTLTSSSGITSAVLTAMRTKKLVGASAIRSRGFFSAATPIYELAPRLNVTRKINGDHVSTSTPWNWFVNTETKLNSSLNRYEAYIPLNFIAKGDHSIRLIDMTLMVHTGSYSSGTWTAGVLPANGSNDAIAMAPVKAFEGFATYNAKVQAAETCADFITQTSGADVTDTSFIWSITSGPSSTETYDVTGSTVANKAPYPFTQNWDGNTSTAGLFYGEALKSQTPNTAAAEYVKNAEGSSDPYTASMTDNWAGTVSKLNPGAIEDGTTIASESLFATLNTAGSSTPHAFFALDKALADTSALTEAYFYNRVRVRYVRDIKQDIVSITNGEFGAADTGVSLITARNLPVYEAYILIKIAFTGAVGIISVTDIEGDVATNEQINFGSINV